jgi:hypothetical protein
VITVVDIGKDAMFITLIHIATVTWLFGNIRIKQYYKAKAVPLHATKALEWRGGITLTHS